MGLEPNELAAVLERDELKILLMPDVTRVLEWFFLIRNFPFVDFASATSGIHVMQHGV